MSEFVLVNDIHLSDRAPAACTDTYLDDLFELLEQVSTLAGARNAAIVLAGDVFHHKTPSRTSHATVMRLIDWARLALVPVYGVLGNHDLSHDRVASIHETQPLGVVMASGAIQLLDGWMPGEELVYGVPWQMSFDDANVFDALAAYRSNMHMVEYFDERRSAGRAEPLSRHGLVVTHAPLYPPGQELPYENFPAQQWAAAMGNRGTVHYGHVHEPHGIYEVDGVTFSNPGALSRGSLHEHNLTRTPTVAIWDDQTGDVEHVALAAKPADQVFRLVEALTAKKNALDLSGFVQSISATQLDITSTDSVLAHVRATQPDQALVTVITNLLAGAEA